MNISKKRLVAAVFASFLVGILWLAAVRFALIKDESVHYHANFELYVNGERDTFESFTFYEEVQSCSADIFANPDARVHMHDTQNDVIHVHDEGATWGHFFANLGYGLGNGYVKTDEGIFIDGNNGNQLRFILNGAEASGISNKTIGNEDVLLVDYSGDSLQELEKRYSGIANNARDYNSANDPAACAGSAGPNNIDKLKKSFWR